METEPNNNLENNASVNGPSTSVMSHQVPKMTIEIENYDAPPGAEKQHHIKLEDLEDYVQTMTQSGGFKEQYHIIKNGQQKPWDCGKKTENKHKNRYSDLLPYDESRVVLQKLKNDPHSDYINASYVDGYSKKKAYICTQGPLDKTLGDFWRMIWQENVNVIAMTANIIENGKKKCEKYWPEKSTKYADVTVTLQSDEVFLDYTIRNFKIQKAGSSGHRYARQYHFTAWPDHGIPTYPLSLVFMLQDIDNFQEKQQNKSPIVLHCSAGVGRSGTVMVLAAALEMTQTEGKVDVLGVLYKMRQQRVNLIETVEQFTFVYEALVDYHFGDVPSKPSAELVLYFNKLRHMNQETKKSGLEQQFERLKNFDPPRFLEKCASAVTTSNKLKNRSLEILPPDDGRPILKTNPPSNYINAVYVHDYAKANHFVVTQFPLPETVIDLWQLLYDLNSSTIVVLNEFSNKDKNSPVFWPQSGSLYQGNFKIENVASDPEFFNGVLTRKLKVRNAKGSLKSRSVKMFHLHGWSREDFIPPQIDSIVHLLNKVHRWNNKTGQKTVLVTCFDGCRASGFYCAASYLAGQVIKESGKVDVVQAVRTVRLNRPAFLPTVEQYRWLYELACFLITNKKMLK